MNFYLDTNKIEYVLFHMRCWMQLQEEVWHKMIFCQHDSDIAGMEGKIVFLLSNEEIDYQKIFNYEDVPILFPIDNSKNNSLFSFVHNNLVFHHDLIKSAFYLLSCYQEYNSEEKDTLGRYDYDASIQKRLGITTKPIINYYFDIIAGGITEFCLRNNLTLPTKKSADQHYLFLSHDVDRINFYSIPNLLYKVKETIGLVKTDFSFNQNIRLLMQQIIKLLNRNMDNDPYWNFNFLFDSERNLGFRSTFFFLHKDIPHKDGYYTFNEPRIKDLFDLIAEKHGETAFHNSLGSVDAPQKIKHYLEVLQANCLQTISGVRQHWLRIDVPASLVVFDEVGFRYDSSLCFAKHIGFRSSYCFPHKVFDHQHNKMLDLWEIPLIIMDSTLFDYQKYSFSQANISIQSLKEEVKKFGGVFSLLWHNSYFDEIKYPGITSFYLEILSGLHSENFQSLTGNEIIDMYEVVVGR